MSEIKLPKGPFADLTLLNEKAGLDKYADLCKNAMAHSDLVRSLCLPPNEEIVRFCSEMLKGGNIPICTVIDFPFGNGGLVKKQFRVMDLRELGVEEFDVVINLPALAVGDLEKAAREIHTLVYMTEIIRIKTIMETGHFWYSDAYLMAVARKLHQAGAWCLKTSTGLKPKSGEQFIDTPAGKLGHITLEEKIRHAKLMLSVVPDTMIKIAGGITTMQDVEDICAQLPAEQTMIGTSSEFWLYQMPD